MMSGGDCCSIFACGLLEHLDAVIDATQTGILKPDTRAYALALAALKLPADRQPPELRLVRRADDRQRARGSLAQPAAVNAQAQIRILHQYHPLYKSGDLLKPYMSGETIVKPRTSAYTHAHEAYQGRCYEEAPAPLHCRPPVRGARCAAHPACRPPPVRARRRCGFFRTRRRQGGGRQPR